MSTAVGGLPVLNVQHALPARAEAIRMANETEFGLAAYFYTRDLARTFRVGERLEYDILNYTELKYLCVGM